MIRPLELLGRLPLQAALAALLALALALASCADKSNTCSIGDHHASCFASGAGVWNAFMRASHSATTGEEEACLGKSSAGSNASVVFMTITRRESASPAPGVR